MLTQTDKEQLARQIRARGMNSSWDELLEFCQTVVGNLADAYQILLANPSFSDTVSTKTSELSALLKEKMCKALVSLASEAHVIRWESEVLVKDVPGNPETT